MKRLVSRTEKARKTKRTQIIMGVCLAFLMVLSVLGFALQGNLGGGASSEKITYNGLEFVYVNEFWRIGDFAFKYNPEQVPDVGFGLRDATLYQRLPAYVYSEDSEAEIELIFNLDLVAGEVQRACIDEEGINCSEEPLVKTCEDNFIIIREGGVTSIRQEDNCVYIEGLKEDLLKLVDQFLFKILGVK